LHRNTVASAFFKCFVFGFDVFLAEGSEQLILCLGVVKALGQGLLASAVKGGEEENDLILAGIFLKCAVKGGGEVGGMVVYSYKYRAGCY